MAYGYEVVGDEELEGDVLGAGAPVWNRGAAAMRARRGAMIQLPQKPAWRQSQITPGVYAPRESLELLPLTATNGTGIFDATHTSFTFAARPQRPFRPERLLVVVARSGAAGVLLLSQGIFVGTRLQQVQIGATSIEFFSNTAVGVRLNLEAAQPGIDISMVVQTSSVPAGADTLTPSIVFLGHALA